MIITIGAAGALGYTWISYNNRFDYYQSLIDIDTGMRLYNDDEAGLMASRDISSSLATLGIPLPAEIKVNKLRIIEFFIYPMIKYWNQAIQVR